MLHTLSTELLLEICDYLTYLEIVKLRIAYNDVFIPRRYSDPAMFYNNCQTICKVANTALDVGSYFSRYFGSKHKGFIKSLHNNSAIVIGDYALNYFDRQWLDSSDVLEVLVSYKNSFISDTGKDICKWYTFEEAFAHMLTTTGSHYIVSMEDVKELYFKYTNNKDTKDHDEELEILSKLVEKSSYSNTRVTTKKGVKVEFLHPDISFIGSTITYGKCSVNSENINIMCYELHEMYNYAVADAISGLNTEIMRCGITSWCAFHMHINQLASKKVPSYSISIRESDRLYSKLKRGNYLIGCGDTIQSQYKAVAKTERRRILGDMDSAFEDIHGRCVCADIGAVESDNSSDNNGDDCESNYDSDYEADMRALRNSCQCRLLCNYIWTNRSRYM